MTLHCDSANLRALVRRSCIQLCIRRFMILTRQDLKLRLVSLSWDSVGRDRKRTLSSAAKTAKRMTNSLMLRSRWRQWTCRH